MGFTVIFNSLWLQEYSEDSNSEPDVDLENQYYNSKALKEDDPKAALASFQKVLDLEGGEKGEWGFKALKQMIKINFKLVRVQLKYHVFCDILQHTKQPYSTLTTHLVFNFCILDPKQTCLNLN